MSFFGEPALFAGYLILALVFMLKDPSRFPKRYYFVIGFTLITTQSTAGYLIGLLMAIFLITTRNTASSRKAVVAQPFGRLLLAALLLIGFFMAYSTFTFLGEKINSQFSIAEEEGNNWQLTRYGNAILDLQYIKERPFTGWSPLLETRQLETEDFAQRQGNGLTGFTVRYGITGIGIYFIFAFRTLSRFFGHRAKAMVSLLIILFMLNGGHFLLLPAFLALMFNPGTQNSRRNIELSEPAIRVLHKKISV